jgi:hypothetical protein
MSLLLHRFVAAGKGPGGPSGYYYRIDPEAQYYTGNFQASQPAPGGGWILQGYRGNGNRFIATLGTTGTVTAFKTDSNNSLIGFSSMSGFGQFTSSDDRLVHTHEQSKIGFTSKSGLTYTTPLLNGSVSGIVMGVDDANNRVYFNYNTGGGYQPTICRIISRNASTGAVVWAKEFTSSNNSWYYPDKAIIRSGDTGNVWVQISRSSIGFLVLDRATGAFVNGYEFSNATMSNAALSMIQDPSGNMYISGYNGHIARVNTSNTTDWAKVYSFNGQGFGYTHICYYDGYIYGTGSQHSNGNFLFKLNPSDGTLVWFINMPNSSNGFYGITGVSAGPDGIGVVGTSAGAGGFEKSWFLNYPLDAGITGTYGDMTFASGSASGSSISASFTTVGTPNLSNASVTSGTASYGSSINTATSIFNSKVNLQ